MKRSILFTFCSLIFLTSFAYAETFANNTNVESGMSFWDEFAGKWRGNGWRLSESGEKIDLQHDYTIQLKLDNTMLILENTTTIHGEVNHQSIVIVTYDKTAGNFPIQFFRTISPPGNQIGVVENGAFIYFMQENYRFSMKINEEGQIYESGEVKMGDQWVQFYEMVSIKQN